MVGNRKKHEKAENKKVTPIKIDRVSESYDIERPIDFRPYCVLFVLLFDVEKRRRE